MENVTPTRMVMLLKKRQIKVAESGVSLLKNKRDALLSEFLNLIKPLLKEYKELDRTIKKAVNTLIFALGKDGSEELRSAALLSAKELVLKMREKKLWGVSVPEVEKKDGKKGISSKLFSPFSVTTRIDETTLVFENLIDKILKIVPLEIKFKRIGEEIKKTTRRVNALEQKIIPRLKEEVTYIRRTLEDREREDKFRMKLLKRKRV
ncbi:MAG: V-type ATP synthase subunit D [Candidatus Hydrothermales bacterium]